MHRTQGEKFQIHSDFDEHFREVWTGDLRAIFSECRESEDSHEKSIFLLFRQNIPLGELIQGKVV